MSIIRVEKNTNYSVISNVHLQDNNLSWKAKGLLSYLLSKPNDWTIYLKHLAKQSKDGTDSTRTALNELIESGYISKEYARNEKGHIIGRDYIVRENPIKIENKTIQKSENKKNPKLEQPRLEKPILDKPILEKPTLLNTDGTHYSSLLKTDNDQREKPKTQKPSPSHFDNEIKELIELIPKHNITEELSPQFKAIFLKALIAGHTVAYIALAITYTKDKSKGSPQEFKAYLGKTLDNNYHAGYVSKADERRQQQEKQRQLEADRRDRERLKMQQERQEMEKIKAQNIARSKALESLKSLNPDRYKEVEAQAIDILKSRNTAFRVDKSGLFIKSEMSKILGL